MNLINGEKVREKGSLFFALAHRVNNTDDVQDGYKLAHMLYGEATHIVCAYRLSNAVGHKNQDCIDDGEFGAGRCILEVLKHEKMENVAVYGVRYYGGIHLGYQRFEIYEEICRGVIRLPIPDPKSTPTPRLCTSSITEGENFTFTQPSLNISKSSLPSVQSSTKLVQPLIHQSLAASNANVPV